MVRTRGLGHVTGRGVGTGDHDDSDDALQRRRSTASARRQRVAVTTEHDEPVVPATQAEGVAVQDDVYVDKPMAEGDVQDTRPDIIADTSAQATEDKLEGFSSDPSNPSMLTEYADHIAGSVWTREVFIILNLSQLLIILYH